jgi:hypothetical protein
VVVLLVPGRSGAAVMAEDTGLRGFDRYHSGDLEHGLWRLEALVTELVGGR